VWHPRRARGTRASQGNCAELLPKGPRLWEGGTFFCRILSAAAEAVVGSLSAGNGLVSRVTEHRGCCRGAGGRSGPPGGRRGAGGCGAPLGHSPPGDSGTGSTDIGVQPGRRAFLANRCNDSNAPLEVGCVAGRRDRW